MCTIIERIKKQDFSCVVSTCNKKGNKISWGCSYTEKDVNLYALLHDQPSKQLDHKKINLQKLCFETIHEPEYYIKNVVPKSINLDINGFTDNIIIGQKNILFASMHCIILGAYDNAFKNLEYLKNNNALSGKIKNLLVTIAIELRKSKNCANAQKCYELIEIFFGEDVNLKINIARCFYDTNNKKECLYTLKKAMQMDPNNNTAKEFYIQAQKKL